MAFSDQYVILMEKMIHEQKKISESLQAVDDLKKRLDAQQQPGSPSVNTTTTKTLKSAAVPQVCKNAVRTCYKELLKKEDYNGFDLSVGFNAPENKNTRERLIKAVIDENGGKEGCMFSRTYIQAAVKQYFNSQKDKKHKADTGKQEEHKVKCRRQGRIRENCKRMKVGLRRKPWSEEKKKKISEILTPQYMSEEESDYEELEDGRTILMGYRVKTIPWIHPRIKDIKTSLMNSYLDTLTMFQRSGYRQRVVSTEEASSKPMPNNCPQWVLNGNI